MNNQNNQSNEPKLVTADPLLSNLAYRLAHARANIKQNKNVENDAREDIIAYLGLELDVNVCTPTGGVLLNVREHAKAGSIDWAAFAADHPDLDFDKYRRPATTSVVIRTGSVAEKLLETEQEVLHPTTPAVPD